MSRQVTVSAHAYGQWRMELEDLEGARPEVVERIAQNAAGDQAERAYAVGERAELDRLDRRIAELRELLRTAVVAREPTGPVDVVGVGRQVVVRFGGAASGQLLLIGELVEKAAAPANATVVTPGSELGRALLGARVGETRTYQVNGVGRQVRVLRVA